METMKLVVEVSASSAILNGSASAGEQYWPLVGVLPLLSQEVRAWLAHHVRHEDKYPNGVFHLYKDSYHHTIVLNVPSVSNETVAEAITDVHGLVMAEIEAKNQEHESKVAEILARPIEDWLRESNDSCYHLDGVRIGKPYAARPYWLNSSIEKDPRIVARFDEAKAIAAGRLLEWQKAYDTFWAQKKAAEEAEAAAQEASEKAMREWVTSCEGLPARVRRAASEGYEIAPTIKRIVGDAIRMTILSVVGPIGGDIVELFGTIEDSNRVPSDAAYAIHDALVEQRSLIASAALVPGAEVTVGPFKRVDVSPSRSTAYRGAVRVDVTTPWLGTFTEHVLTEPANLDDDEDEDEDEEDK